MNNNKKNIETRVEINGNILRFFCIENKNEIVGCDWYDTKYCLRTCKFYKNKQESADNSTKVK